MDSFTNRLARFLAAPERTPPSERASVPVFALALDEIDFAAHDRRYHHGHFDPATMTCAMRDAINTGDLADVLTAEREEEERSVDYYIHHPQELSDDDFVAMLGNPEMGVRCKFKHVLRSMFKSATKEGGGDKLGECLGMPVFMHAKMADEFTMSRNSNFLSCVDHARYRDKIRMVRHLQEVFNSVTHLTESQPDHASKRHGTWQVCGGFVRAYFSYAGNDWYCVFTKTGDGRFLLYDVAPDIGVRK